MMPWVLSILTLIQTVLLGRKSPIAWLLSMANNVLWIVWAVQSHNYGFMPMAVILFALAALNYRRWTR